MKNDCDIVKDLLPTYVENICSPPTNEYIKTHLETCSDCNGLYLAMNNPLNISTEIISEKKVFSKIKNRYRNQFLIGITACILICLLFGTNFVSELTKFRFKVYLKTHYPEYNLELSGFKYVDMETLGFGSNGAYVADVYAEDENNNPDLKFSLSTKNFSFKITDNYKYQIKKSKAPTKERLALDYIEDVKYTLLHKLPALKLKNVDFTINDKLDEISTLTLNQKYERTIDSQMPIQLYIDFYNSTLSTSELTKTLDLIITTLKTHNFNPNTYSFTIFTKESNSIFIEDIKPNYQNLNELELLIKKASENIN